MEGLYTEQMNHMIERDKLEIRCSKMPIQQKKQDIEQIKNSIKGVKELQANMLKEISKYEQSQKETNEEVDDRYKIKENVKEVYVQDLCQKTMFDEVYKK